MPKNYIISYDFGTSGVKAVVVDTGGSVSGSATENYRMLSPQLGWAEHDPDDYWSAVCGATRAALRTGGVRPESVIGLVFGTMWKCIIPVGKDGRPLCNSIIWLDGRAGKQAAQLNERLHTDRFCDKDYITRLMWLKECRPDIYNAADCIFEANSYLKFRATGEKGTDLTNDFFHCLDPDRQAEFDRLTQAAGLDKDKFPPLVMPWDEVGRLTFAAANELFLCEGTPVFGGCGDIPAITIGSGRSAMYAAHMYRGSSGWLGVVAPEQYPGVGELYQSLDRGKEIMVYAVQSACMTFNWAIDQLYHEEKERLGAGIFDFVNQEIADVPAGSMNLIVTPWLHGERPPLSEEAKSVFFNLTNLHTRRHMINAVLEGICYTLRWKIETYEKDTGRRIESVRIVGGGATSGHWMQVMSDVLGIPVEIPANSRYAGAIGTAYCAFIGLGLCKDFEEANRMIGVERSYRPCPDNAPVYQKLYEVFKTLYPALKDAFHKLNS